MFHGIEKPDERLKKGKSAYGHIKLSSRLTNKYIKIIIEDDGRGVDFERIKYKFLEEGYSSEYLDTLSDDQVIGMLFKSHFSTNEESDLSAGRGLGLDIIKNYVQCLRGEVKILDSNKGLKLEIKFPNDVEDIIQPNGFHLLTNLINESFVSSFKSKQVNVFLHDKSLKEDIILGNKLSIAEIFLFISEYLKKSAFDFERIFIDVFKFEGKRKIDFDNVYRLVIGVQGDAVDFDRRDPYLERAKDLSKKLGGSFIFRGQSLVELNLPSGFKGVELLITFQSLHLRNIKNLYQQVLKDFLRIKQWIGSTMLIG